MKHARHAFWFFAMATMLAACTQLGLVPAQTFTEKVAYVEAGAQGAIKTLADLTCRKYTAAGACTEATRPLHPARAGSYLDSLSMVRRAARAAGTMANTGGDCLGQPSTPIACLTLATTMLTEVQQIIADVKRK